MSAQPIFLLSLPRAGSTLLQRLLCQHADIASTPEPWIAIPPFYALKSDGVGSVYGHSALCNAVSGFVDALPAKRTDYLNAASHFLQQLYNLASPPGSRYFLDKTPRYHLIVDDLMEAFPDAKFIFLWRNPLAIASSMMQTWGHGKWNLYMFWVDLYQGIDALVSAFEQNKNRAIAVRYEDLATSPKQELSKILEYLDLDDTTDMLESFATAKIIDAPGRGDPTGQYRYRGVSSQSADAWKAILANPFRKAWAKNYLTWLGPDRLATMGFDKHELEADIYRQPTAYHHLASDIFRNILGRLYCRYSVENVRRNKPWRGRIFFTQY